MPLSAAMERVYDGTYTGLENATNELFSRFKYTPLEGFDYHGHDGTLSRRDATKIIKANGNTTYGIRTVKPRCHPIPNAVTTPFRRETGTWLKSGTRPVKTALPGKSRALPYRGWKKPYAGWRSVSTPDILVYQGKYYLYYQAYTMMPGGPGTSATNGDDCPVAASVADSPDGPWIPSNKVVVENGPPGTWDQYVIHDPYPLVYRGQIYLYYKGEMGGSPKVRAQGLAIADDPFGPFVKHPLNPVINSGHETALFPFREGVAALVSRHGLEHNTIQYAPDGVNFEMAAISALFPIAPGAYIPDAFTDSEMGAALPGGSVTSETSGLMKERATVCWPGSTAT